jgi:hypothetical protein
LTTAPHENQTVHLSNIPGDLYRDGTFEFFGVPPGRHSIITRSNPTDAYPSGASVVVRGQDVENVLLEETPLTPLGNRIPPLPLPVGNRPSGNVPLARITGTIVENASRQPVADGAVVIKSEMFYSESFPLDANGRFEIPALLPGSYELEVKAFGHDTVKRSVELADQDINVDFVVRRIRSGL